MAIVILNVFVFIVLATLVWATTQPSAADSSTRADAQRSVDRVSGARYDIGSAAYVVYGERCRSARKAVAYYRAKVWALQDQWLGRRADRTPVARGKTCRWARYAAAVHQDRAQAAQRALRRWLADEWNWQAWLPDKFARVGACETGYGRRPGSWTWDSGTYVSAFGIYRPAYAQFARMLGLPTWDDPGQRTPREQYRVAAAIQARYGWGAWGCGGA